MRRLVGFGLLIFAVLAILSGTAAAQAILGATDGSNNAVVFPTPDQGLPNPTQLTVPGLPAGARPHGVAYYGSDNALVSDFGNSRIFVVQISTTSLVDTISTAPSGYDGTGSITVAPGLNFAIACGGSSNVLVIAAPFTASSTQTTVAIPGSIAGYQTQAIVFNAAGRAFIHHTTGISVMDPPYTGVAFTIPTTFNGTSGALAISPDGNTLLATALDNTNGNVHIFDAPFSAGSTDVILPIPGAVFLDGIAVTPDGTKALVVSAATGGTAWAISPPFTPSSTVEPITVPGGTFEDVGISADSQLAILAGNGGATPDTPFIQAPFTTAGAVVSNVQVTGGRGNGAVRFLPPGLAPGLTITKSGPPTANTGSNITYTITYGNTGGADANGVIIKDPVPAGTTFVSATGGGTESGGVVTWNIGTVPAGTINQTVTFTVTVTATSGTISNVNYTIESSTTSPIPGPPVFTQVGGGGPTPTPTPIGPTPTPGGGPPAPIPTLSPWMLAVLAVSLLVIAILAIRRQA